MPTNSSEPGRDDPRLAFRVRKRELFRSLGYEPHPGQVEVHRSRASRRVLACGARWGKSTCAAMEAVAALLTPCEESIGWLVGPNYGLTERIFRRVQAVVEKHLAHRVVELSVKDRMVVMRNLGGGQSELRCKSADNPASLLGEGLDWLIVDEAARLREDIWPNYLSQRLMDKAGWALIVSTPRGCNWFRGVFQRARVDDDFQSWAFPSVNNPLLNAQLIEAERKRLEEDVFAQEYLAEFLGAPPEPCDVCGGPSPDVSEVYLHWGEEEVGTCALCGEYVDWKGRTAVHLDPEGDRRVKIIVLQGGPGTGLDPLLVPPFVSMLRSARDSKFETQEDTHADQRSAGGVPSPARSGRSEPPHAGPVQAARGAVDEVAGSVGEEA